MSSVTVRAVLFLLSNVYLRRSARFGWSLSFFRWYNQLAINHVVLIGVLLAWNARHTGRELSMRDDGVPSTTERENSTSGYDVARNFHQWLRLVVAQLRLISPAYVMRVSSYDFFAMFCFGCRRGEEKKTFRRFQIVRIRSRSKMEIEIETRAKGFGPGFTSSSSSHSAPTLRHYLMQSTHVKSLFAALLCMTEAVKLFGTIAFAFNFRCSYLCGRKSIDRGCQLSRISLVAVVNVSWNHSRLNALLLDRQQIHENPEASKHIASLKVSWEEKLHTQQAQAELVLLARRTYSRARLSRGSFTFTFFPPRKAPPEPACIQPRTPLNELPAGLSL